MFLITDYELIDDVDLFLYCCIVVLYFFSKGAWDNNVRCWEIDNTGICISKHINMAADVVNTASPKLIRNKLDKIDKLAITCSQIIPNKFVTYCEVFKYSVTEFPRLMLVGTHCK